MAERVTEPEDKQQEAPPGARRACRFPTRAPASAGRQRTMPR